MAHRVRKVSLIGWDATMMFVLGHENTATLARSFPYRGPMARVPPAKVTPEHDANISTSSSGTMKNKTNAFQCHIRAAAHENCLMRISVAYASGRRTPRIPPAVDLAKLRQSSLPIYFDDLGSSSRQCVRNKVLNDD